MNLPNKLTILRVLMVPAYVVFMLCDITEYDNWIALVIFVAASFTDLFDGYLARKNNLITNFGKFMDPLADKLLICSALICFVHTGQLYTWIVLIIIAREFIISGIRLIAADDGIVIAAGFLGKLKTVVSMFMIGFLLVDKDIPWLHVFTEISVWLSLVLTVLSLIDYIVKNKHIFR